MGEITIKKIRGKLQLSPENRWQNNNASFENYNKGKENPWKTLPTTN